MIQALQQGLATFFAYIPQLIGAIIILIVGYIVARVLRTVVARVLQAIGFDRWMERGGIKQFFDRAQTRETPATVLGILVFWFVFIIAITMAADALGIQQVSEVLAQLIAYIPSIIAAILILVLAALLANFLAGIVRGATGSDLLSNIARYAILIYAAFAAITELGIAVQLTAPTFLIILGAAALAAAIAFGFGAQGVARDIIEKAYERRDEVTSDTGQGTSATESETDTAFTRGADGQGEGRAASAATADRRYEEGRDLVKMSISNFVLEDRSQDLRGRNVYDNNGDEIGEVEDLYVDREEERVRFLSVSAGGALGLGKKHFLIPMEDVTEARPDRVVLSQDRERVTSAPEFNEEAEPDHEYQQAVYRHYGHA